MTKRFLTLMILLILTTCSLGYMAIRYNANNNDGNTSMLPAGQQLRPGKPQSLDADIKGRIGAITLEEKIGQMLIFGLEGYTAGERARELIQDYKAGGIIILGENVKSTSQLLSLINSIKQMNSKNQFPLFVSVDQEGGRVDRMPSEFKSYPTNSVIGKINDAKFSYEVGRVIGEEIKAFGFNMDFAPVLDINSNPRNPIIGNRAFGSEPGVVSRLGIQTMEGIRSAGIIPVVKHFPGHGDTTTDSHLGLPVVDNGLNRLKKFELVPFTEAVKERADVVMIAHILLKKIDKRYPASLSKYIISDILRKRLGFGGVVITDDMTMGAIIKNYDIGEAAVKSVLAGSDIILVCHGSRNEEAVVKALKNAVKSGTIPIGRIDESVYRILMLKKKYNLKDSKISSIDVQSINKSIDSVLGKYVKGAK